VKDRYPIPVRYQHFLPSWYCICPLPRAGPPRERFFPLSPSRRFSPALIAATSTVRCSARSGSATVALMKRLPFGMEQCLSGGDSEVSGNQSLNHCPRDRFFTCFAMRPCLLCGLGARFFGPLAFARVFSFPLFRFLPRARIRTSHFLAALSLKESSAAECCRLPWPSRWGFEVYVSRWACL